MGSLIKQITTTIFVVILITALFLIMIEGVASICFTTREYVNSNYKPLAERSYTRYDSMLGWTAIPHTYRPNFFTQGAHVSINAQGFRATQNYTDTEPEDRVRVICSGDSFTFGNGVSDNETWPAILSTLEPRIETINMALGGFGLDQAYLRYTQERDSYEHSIHIMAFIYYDLLRIHCDNFSRYPKPMLSITDSGLAPINTPLKKRSFLIPLIIDHIRPLKTLRIMQFLHARETVKRNTRTSPVFSQPTNTLTSQDTHAYAQEIATAIFDDLYAESIKQKNTCILVYLPTQQDYKNGPASQQWRSFLHATAKAKPWIFLDLTPSLQTINADAIHDYFISKTLRPNDGGHYSPQGNRFIAQELYKQLSNHAETKQYFTS